MKIAIVAPFPVADSAPSGGVAAVAQSLVRHFVANGHCCHVVAVNAAYSAMESRSDLLHVHSLSRGTLPGVLDFWLRMPDRIVSILRTIRPDIVHVHGPAVWADAATAVAPCVLTIHGAAEREILIRHRHLGALAFPIVRAVEEHYAGQLPCVIRISPYVDELRKISSIRHVFDIPNPIDDIFYGPTSITPSVRAATRLVWVGHAGPGKKLDKAVELVAAAKRAGRYVSIDLFGVSGAEQTKFMRHCRRLITAHAVEDRIVWHGRRPQSDLIDALDSAGALLLTSSQETAPCVISEALARGTFVVAPREFGIPYMITKSELGFLYEANGDFAEIVEQALVAISEFSKCSGERRAAAEKYRAESVGRATLRVYEQLLAA